jgi:diguanylate cyclase (GGDEF)-like protein
MLDPNSSNHHGTKTPSGREKYFGNGHDSVRIRPMRRVCTAILPGGLLLTAALVLLRPGALPDSILPYVHAYPYVVFGAGVVLGWLFNRSRIVFAVVVLALADGAVLRFAAGDAAAAGSGRVLFNAVALLLPLDLVAIAMIGERGILTARGLGRLMLILSQCLLVAWLCLPGQRGAAAMLEYRFVNADLSAWTSVPQPALLAFGSGLAIQTVRFFLHRNAIEGGMLWALVAAFIALHGNHMGWAATNFFATAGLILVIAVFETSYRMAYHDDLTGLPGRRALNETLLKLGNRYAVAMVDIDRFKQFNDQHGHDVGDQVLRMVASKLERVSGGGKGFRYGGEEFAVVFPGQSMADVLPHLESLRKAVQASCFVLRGPDRPKKKPDTPRTQGGPGKAVFVTVSIGVAERDERRRQPGQVIRAADDALYRAKKAGRNQVRA